MKLNPGGWIFSCLFLLLFRPLFAERVNSPDSLYGMLRDARQFLGQRPAMSSSLSEKVLRSAREKKNQEVELQVLELQADAAFLQYQHDLASARLIQAIDLAGRLGNDKARASCLFKMGRLHWMMEDVSKALFFLAESEKAAIYSGDQRLQLLAEAYKSYLQIFQNKPGERNDFLKVKELYDFASSQPSDLSLLIQASNLMGNISELHLMDPGLATQYYAQAIHLCRQASDKYQEAVCLQNIAEVYLKQGKIGLAQKELENSLEISRKINSWGLIFGGMKLLSACAAAEMDYRKAYEYQLAYEEIRSRYLNESQLRSTDKILKDYNSRKKVLQEQELERSKASASQERENRMRTIWLMLFLALVFSILLALLIFFNRNKTREILFLHGKVSEHEQERQSRDQWLREEILKTQEHEKKAASLLKSKADFLSVVTHEIRTPLHAVLATSRIIEQSAELNATGLKHLEVLRFSADNLLALINNVLDYNRLEANKIELDAKPFSLRELLEGLQMAFSSQAEDKGIELVFRIEKELPGALLGDRLRLLQILSNLLTNAIRFTEKGAVVLTVCYDQTQGSDGNLSFTVQDTGIGMDENEIPQISGFYFQVSPEISSRFGGSGIGLALTSGLLNLMGSRLIVNSKKGVGSEFSFLLKLPETNPVFLMQGNTRQDEKDFSGSRILFVEDVEYNRLLARHFFEKWNIAFDFASTGAEAVSLAEKFQYQLILMDIMLPDFSGFEAASRIAALGSITKPKIIAMSAMDHFEIREKMEQCGMKDVLSKPFSQNELRHLLQKWIFNPPVP